MSLKTKLQEYVDKNRDPADKTSPTAISQSTSSFIRNKISNATDTITAKASGAINSRINGALDIADKFLNKLFGGPATLARIATKLITFAEENVIRIDQKIAATIHDPQQVPITSDISSVSFAESASSSNVTSIAPTQLNNTIVEPVGPEPPLAFRGQYPYVHTYQSESGHIKEVDDTPGYERLFDYHTSGTYQEINADGRRVLKVVGDNYVVVVHDDHIYVGGNRDLQVNGNMNITCFNDALISVAGRVELNVGEELKMKAKSISMETTGGDVNIYSAGKFNTQSQGTTSMYSRSNLNLLAGNSMSVAAAKTLAMGAVVKASIESQTIVAFDANVISTNKGQSAPVAAANTVIVTSKTGLGSAPSRSTATAPSVLDIIAQGLDDDVQSVDKAINEAIAQGRITKAEADSMRNKTYSTIKSDTSSPPSTKLIASSAASIKGLTETSISGQIKLSDHYTLYHLTDGALYKNTLVAQGGRTKAQITGNLSLLAQNVLEPILQKFGPIQINNAFRVMPAGVDVDKSQHFKGMAADITYGIRSTDPEKMYEIAQWIKNHVPFDQLILEYGQNQIWTHVSFNGEGAQRALNTAKKVATCPNPFATKPLYLDGLHILDWTRKY